MDNQPTHLELKVAIARLEEQQLAARAEGHAREKAIREDLDELKGHLRETKALSYKNAERLTQARGGLAVLIGIGSFIGGGGLMAIFGMVLKSLRDG